MVRYLRSLAICAAVALTPIACQQQATEQEGATEEEVAAGADIQATIEESNAAFEQAMLTGDTAAMVAGYADDAIVQPPHMPPSSGKDAIRTLFAEMVAESRPGTFDIITENVTVAESGELAYETGSYTVSGTTPEGETWEDHGKYLSVWEKSAEGQWQTVALSWSPNASPPGMYEEGVAPEAEPGATPEGGA